VPRAVRACGAMCVGRKCKWGALYGSSSGAVNDDGSGMAAHVPECGEVGVLEVSF